MRILIILLLAGSLFSFEFGENLDGWGVVDIYYGYDFNEPDNHVRQPFYYQHNRHNEFNLNMALFGLDYNDGRIRGNLTLQAGTYAQDNYVAEEGMLKNVFEAYLGTRLTSSGSAWIDAGIFGSHLGFESAISNENPVLTRSLSSESSPYFLSGVRTNWQATENLLLYVVVANGWQRIRRVLGNQLPGLGLQVQYTPNNFTFNYSNFVFNDEEDAVAIRSYNRHFHNIYAKYENMNIYLLGGVDIGFDLDSQNGYSSWQIISSIIGYKLDSNWQVSARGEYIWDINNYVIPPTSFSTFQRGEPRLSSFEAYSVSLGVDRIIGNGLFVRTELRHLGTLNQELSANDNLYHNNFTLMFSISKTFK